MAEIYQVTEGYASKHFITDTFDDFKSRNDSQHKEIKKKIGHNISKVKKDCDNKICKIKRYIEENKEANDKSHDDLKKDIYSGINNTKNQIDKTITEIRGEIERTNLAIEGVDSRLTSVSKIALTCIIGFSIMLSIALYLYGYSTDKYNKLLSQYDIIVSENTKMMAQIDALENDISKLSNKPNVNLTDISAPSNLTESQLNEIISRELSRIGISNSKFNDIGKALVQLETDYKINALFCISVASLESGHGTSSAAINHNNLFGLIGHSGIMHFNSIEDCIIYWGKLIREDYMNSGRKTIQSIQIKYCPNSFNWSSSVDGFMKKYASYIKI